MNYEDFKLITDTIREIYDYQKDSDGNGSKRIKQGAIKVTAEALAEAFKARDPHFKRGRFLWDCGVKQFKN